MAEDARAFFDRIARRWHRWLFKLNDKLASGVVDFFIELVVTLYTENVAMCGAAPHGDQVLCFAVPLNGMAKETFALVILLLLLTPLFEERVNLN